MEVGLLWDNPEAERRCLAVGSCSWPMSITSRMSVASSSASVVQKIIKIRDCKVLENIRWVGRHTDRNQEVLLRRGAREKGRRDINGKAVLY